VELPGGEVGKQTEERIDASIEGEWKGSAMKGERR